MNNLLEHFALAHTQLSRLHADLAEPVSPDQAIKAKVELKLTPRETAESQGDHPGYQVTAHLTCRGVRADDPESKPLFTVEMVLQALYRQVQGEVVDFQGFSRNHLSLTRQLYPLIHQQLLPVLKQFGLDNLRLPHDLFEAPGARGAGDQPVH